MNYPAFLPPARLLMGPGPIDADPRVLKAMSNQLIGQFDPKMTDVWTRRWLCIARFSILKIAGHS